MPNNMGPPAVPSYFGTPYPADEYGAFYAIGDDEYDPGVENLIRGNDDDTPQPLPRDENPATEPGSTSSANDSNRDGDDGDPASFFTIVDHPIERICQICSQTFPSGNKLHRHIRTCIGGLPKALHASEQVDIPLIISKAPKARKDGLAHQGWHYASLKASAIEKGEEFDICVDTGCSLGIVDQGFLNRHYPGAEIHKSKQPIKIRGIGSKIHQGSGFVTISLYLRGQLDTKEARAQITREFHVVPDLRANVLLGIDTLVPEAMVIDLPSKALIIGSCRNLQVPVRVSTYNPTASVVKPPKNDKSANSWIMRRVATDMPSSVHPSKPRQ